MFLVEKSQATVASPDEELGKRAVKQLTSDINNLYRLSMCNPY